MHSARLLSASRPVLAVRHARSYASKYPRPKPGTSERPPPRYPDPLTNTPNASVQSLEGGKLTFIHRTPPTVPSPFSLTTSPASAFLRPPTRLPGTEQAPPLPPHIRPSAGAVEVPPRASDEVVQEIRKLRLSNPAVWTRGKLAKKFGCTQGFVGAIAALPKSQRKEQLKKRDGEHEKVREGWTEKVELVRAIRKKRREFW